jgi:hypothetical protein
MGLHDIVLGEPNTPVAWRAAVEEWINLQIQNRANRAAVAIHRLLGNPVIFMTYSLERAGRVHPDRYAARFVGIRTLKLPRESLRIMTFEFLDEILREPCFIQLYGLVFPELYSGYLQMSQLSGKPVVPYELVEYTKRILELPNGILYHRKGVEEAARTKEKVDQRKYHEARFAEEIRRQGLDPIPQNSTEQRIHDQVRERHARERSGGIQDIKPAPGWGVRGY